jgi:hypothetical protein
LASEKNGREGHCKIVDLNELGCCLSALLEPELAYLTQRGGRLLDYDAVGSRVHLLLSLAKGSVGGL